RRPARHRGRRARRPGHHVARRIGLSDVTSPATVARTPRVLALTSSRESFLRSVLLSGISGARKAPFFIHPLQSGVPAAGLRHGPHLKAALAGPLLDLERTDNAAGGRYTRPPHNRECLLDALAVPRFAARVPG